MCPQQRSQTTPHRLSQRISFISDQHVIIFATALIQLIWQRLWQAFSLKHSSPHREVLNPWLCECLFMRYRMGNRTSGIGCVAKPRRAQQDAFRCFPNTVFSRRDETSVSPAGIVITIIDCHLFQLRTLQRCPLAGVKRLRCFAAAATVNCSSAWTGSMEHCESFGM